MFEESEAKRICRADLRSRSSSLSSQSEPDEETQVLLQSRLAELYGPINITTTTRNTKHEDNIPEKSGEEVPDEGFEFRLFATSDSKMRKIILEDDDESAEKEGGFMIPWRDSRYYFTEATPLQKQQYESTAISGEDVIHGLQIRHTALEVPWRVSTIKLGQSSYRKLAGHHTQGKDEEQKLEVGLRKRKRMGKKSRILHRKREKIRKESELSEKEKLALKEAAEREKKTKRNREKQQKKRAKEKAKKAGILDQVDSSVLGQDVSIMNE